MNAASSNGGLTPQGERLRRAIRWLSEQRAHTPESIEQTARRFDLTPLEEEFLLRYFTGGDKQSASE